MVHPARLSLRRGSQFMLLVGCLLKILLWVVFEVVTVIFGGGGGYGSLLIKVVVLL
jgi:hypothetical protein